MRLLAALAGLLTTTAALAQPATETVPQGPPPPDMVRGLCAKDGCDEFRVTESREVRPGPDGTLRTTRVQAFHSDASGRSARKTETGYVYCSLTRPAVIAQRDGRTVAFMLAPYAEASAEERRKRVNFVALYFAACHGPEAGRAAAQDEARIARALGYRDGAERSRTVELARAEDILRPDGAPSAGGEAGAPQRQRRDDDAESEGRRYGRFRDRPYPSDRYGDGRYDPPPYGGDGYPPPGGSYREYPYRGTLPDRRYVPRDDDAYGEAAPVPPGLIPYPGR